MAGRRKSNDIIGGRSFLRSLEGLQIGWKARAMIAIQVQIVGFGERQAFEEGRAGRKVWTPLPSDFGTPGYAQRRRRAIEKHFGLFPEEKEGLFWLFDYWTGPSEGLRQYLWAHRPENVHKARSITSILPKDVILRILWHLIGDYWGRYLGWPDLLVHKGAEFIFVEAKSSKDKLSQDQKNWIRANATDLHLPFELVKIHRANPKE